MTDEVAFDPLAIIAGRPKDIGQVELLRVAADEIGRVEAERGR